MGVEPFLVSSTMVVSFAQRLVRTVCTHCKAPYQPSKEVLKVWGIKNIDGANFSQGTGCFNCMHTGFKGRTGVYEVLIIDDIVKDLILKRASAHEIKQAAQSAGNYTPLKHSAAKKAMEGITTLEEAASAVLI
jgi:type IV pilus assembly protein PilB